MSKLVFVFLVSSVFAMAMAQPIENDNTIDVPIEDQKVVLAEPQVIAGRPTLGQIVDRVGDAAHLTIAEERQIIRRALNSLREATGASLRASLDAAHAGLDIFLIVPRFGSKLFSNPL